MDGPAVSAKLKDVIEGLAPPERTRWKQIPAGHHKRRFTTIRTVFECVNRQQRTHW